MRRVGFLVIIDGSHKSWGIVTLALLLLSTGSYVVYVRYAVGGPRGGSVPGMLYGIVGSGLMLYAGLISARKKVPRWRIGTAQNWLRGHLWLGLLSVPLILFHAGFRWGGLLEQVLLLVMVAIVASGLVGLAVQQFLPGQMTVRVPCGTFYAQIPHECRLLQLEGDVAVAEVSSPLEMSPDLEVATPERLKSLGVKEIKDTAKKGKRTDAEQSPADREQQKHQRLLASVYRISETHIGNGEAGSASRPEKEVVVVETAARQTSTVAASDEAIVAHKPPAGSGEAQPALSQAASSVPAAGHALQTPKAKPSAAEMLAAARAKKAAQQPPAGTPAETGPPTQTAEDQPAPSISPAPAKKAKPSAAEMLAAARAKKAAQPVEPTAAASQAASAPDEIPPASSPTTATDSGAAGVPESPAPTKKAKPSAAEMLAAARAKKQTPGGATAADASGHAVAPPAEAPPMPNATPEASASPQKAKPSAAEMLAAVRAKKAAQQAAAASAEPQAEGAPAESMPQAAVKHVIAPPTVERETVSPAVRDYCLKELRGFYVDTVRPFLGERSRSTGPLGNDVTASGLFAAKKAVWPDDLGAVVERLADLCETRRQLAVQERMHRWLHGWLFVHVPLSFCLLGLGVLHAVLSLYY